MNRCPSCDYPLSRERVDARCPNCLDPLYEAPGRASRPAREGEGGCALHAGRESVGTCGRCGNYFCVVCRTRWRDQVLCPACVERALAAREATPEQDRAHSRQDLLGVLLGIGAWGAIIIGILLASAAEAFEAPVLVLPFLLLIPTAILLSVLGLGQAAAALRTRGRHMIAATSGLILSGLFMGVFIGFFVFQLWYS